jgi:hypothetical protein
MALTPGGTPYVESSDLVANYPATSLALAEHIDDLPSGLSIVIPTSIANSGGSASASGGAVTFTGVTTISVNGCFTSTYDNYVIQIVALASGAAPAQYIRLRAAGSDNSTASSYIGQQLFVNGASVTSSRSTDSLFLIGELTTTRSAVALNVYSPALAERTVFRSVTANTRDDGRITDVGGSHTQAVAYDGFTILLSSLNTTGVIRIYGYQNS